MVKWLKDNSVGIVTFVVTFAGAIWSLFWDIAAVAQSNTKVFFVWTITAVALGFAIAWTISKPMKYKAEQQRKEAEHAKTEEENTKRIKLEQEGETQRAQIKQEGETDRLKMKFVREDEERERLNKEAEDKKKKLRDKVFHFSPEQKEVLFRAVSEGVVTLKPEEQMIAQSLENDGLLICLDQRKKLDTSWKPTDLANDIVDEKDTDLWEVLADAEAEIKEKKHRAFLDEQQESFLSLSFNQRYFAYVVWKKGEFCFNRYAARTEDYDSGFLNEEKLEDDMARYTIKPQYEDLFREREDKCFRSVIEYLDKVESENE